MKLAVDDLTLSLKASALKFCEVTASHKGFKENLGYLAALHNSSII